MSFIEEYKYLKELNDSNKIEKAIIGFSNAQKISFLKYCIEKKDKDFIDKFINFCINDDIFIYSIFYNIDLLSNKVIIDDFLQKRDCFLPIKNSFNFHNSVNYGCKNMICDILFQIIINDKNFSNLNIVEDFLYRLISTSNKNNYYISKFLNIINADGNNMDCSYLLIKSIEDKQLNLVDDLFPFSSINKIKEKSYSFTNNKDYIKVINDFEDYISRKKLKEKLNKELAEDLNSSFKKNKRKI